MKKAVLVFLISALVIASTGLWIFSSKGNLKSYDFITFGIIFLVVAFALFIGYRRLTSARRGEPAEDERSKKVLLQTGSVSYYVSLYLWVAVLFIKDRVNLDTEELIGAGILGMALSWVICWVIFHFKGAGNE